MACFLKLPVFLNFDNCICCELMFFFLKKIDDLKEAVIDEVNYGSVIDKLHSLERDIDELRFSKRSSNERVSETPRDKSSK